MAKKIEEIFKEGRTPDDIIADLMHKQIIIPNWHLLRKEYDPVQHPVMDKTKYPDVVDEDGRIEHVTRITYDLQRLSTKRMSELCFGIPVKRIYKAENDQEKEAAKIIEAIMQRNRIDSVNIERGTMLFAGCEFMTLWYAVENKNTLYGIDSDLKIRCRNFSPMHGDQLYPLFDEYGDYVAMSVKYKVKENDSKEVWYFDTYTTDKHIKFENRGGWEVIEDETIEMKKNPTLYCYRPTPIWEQTSDIVYEMEWAMSRNGNYLRKNSKPVWCVFADEAINFGGEQSEKSEFRSILQYPQGSDAGYKTWEQAIENLKFYVNELRQMFFTQLQLPDWSYESMKTTPMSGEARKQLFIDAQMKVGDEKGRLLEFLDRELNVVKAFVKQIAPKLTKAVDSLKIETEITPFTINDDADTIKNLMTATGGKAIVSQREGVQYLGWTDDVENTMKQLSEENEQETFNLTN
jgi:hypothetical protein